MDEIVSRAFEYRTCVTYPSLSCSGHCREGGRQRRPKRAGGSVSEAVRLACPYLSVSVSKDHVGFQHRIVLPTPGAPTRIMRAAVESFIVASVLPSRDKQGSRLPHLRRRLALTIVLLYVGWPSRYDVHAARKVDTIAKGRREGQCRAGYCGCGEPRFIRGMKTWLGSMKHRSCCILYTSLCLTTCCYCSNLLSLLDCAFYVSLPYPHGQDCRVRF